MNRVIEHDQDRAARKTEFEQVMAYATQRAWDAGLEDLVMSALFDLIIGVGEHDGEDLASCPADDGGQAHAS